MKLMRRLIKAEVKQFDIYRVQSRRNPGRWIKVIVLDKGDEYYPTTRSMIHIVNPMTVGVLESHGCTKYPKGSQGYLDYEPRTTAGHGFIKITPAGKDKWVQRDAMMGIGFTFTGIA